MIFLVYSIYEYEFDRALRCQRKVFELANTIFMHHNEVVEHQKMYTPREHTSPPVPFTFAGVPDGAVEVRERDAKYICEHMH